MQLLPMQHFSLLQQLPSEIDELVVAFINLIKKMFFYIKI